MCNSFAIGISVSLSVSLSLRLYFYGNTFLQLGSVEVHIRGHAEKEQEGVTTEGQQGLAGVQWLQAFNQLEKERSYRLLVGHANLKHHT